MSLTTSPTALPVDHTVASWLRRHLGWMLTAVAVAAAAFLVTLVVVDGGSATDSAPAQSTYSADRGSITAIDHQAGSRVTDAGVVEPSIAAIDHHAGGGVRVR